jgi:putative aldouronate transport system permease protein
MMKTEYTQAVVVKKESSPIQRFLKQIEIQSMVLPGILFLIIFSYIPMYGVLIAFKKYNIGNPDIIHAPWTGLKYFREFLTDENLPLILRNTLGMNMIGLAVGFPVTIAFALLLNELASSRFKKLVQTISYLPHFISWAVFAGIIMRMLAVDGGVVNDYLTKLDLVKEPVFFMGETKYFWGISIISGMIKELGWSAIIYLAAITGIDQEMYEAAIVDGAGRFRRMWHITLPSITGTIVILMVLSISGILNSGFEQIYMLQNNLNHGASEVIDTYVYKMGLGDMRYSYATAVGLMKSVVAVILLVGANKFSKLLTDKGIF